jgi:hypothetical protein
MSEPKYGWFGKTWGAPACTPEDHRETPVGSACMWCREPIEAGDQGTLDMLGQPMHIECTIRSVVGGVNHIAGRCKCCGGTEEPDPPELTVRRAARLAMYVHELKRRMGDKLFKKWLDGKFAEYQEMVATGQIEFPGYAIDLTKKPH